MGRTVQQLAWVTTAVLFASVVVLLTAIGSVRSVGATERPNIVFVLTDDLNRGSMRHLDGLRSTLTQNGTTFSRAYVSD